MSPTPVNIYDIGDGVVLEAHFSQDEMPADPTTVRCLVRHSNDETATELSAEHDGVGHFTAEVIVDKTGDWYYRFEGTGVTAAEERRFRVRQSHFT